MTTPRTSPTRTPGAPPQERTVTRVAAVGASALFVIGVGWWGLELLEEGAGLHLPVPPLYTQWREGPVDVWLPAALVVAGLLLAVPAWWTRAVEHLSWRAVLAGSWLVSLAWSVSLAATVGRDQLAEPLLDARYEYLPLARRIGDPGAFVSGFLDRIDSLPTHVRGHPPGAVLAFWGLDGLVPSDGWLALVLVALAAAAAPLSLVALRSVTDDDTARRAAPFAGLAPATVWTATSPDALFAAVVAAAVALGAVAVARGPGRAEVATAGGAGVLAGTCLCLTFGAPLLLAPLAVLWVVLLWRGRTAAAGAMVAGALVAPAGLALLGFDWLAGWEAVRAQYAKGVARQRPYGYFLFSNVAAFAVAVGPAAVAGLAGLRRSRAWWLVGGALGGLLVANLSGMSKGEVERIWLPFVPWVVLATCSIRSGRARTGWSVATMVLTVAIQWRLATPY